MAQHSVLRRVRGGQIQMFFKQYSAPELRMLEGKLVEVRYDPENRDQISVYRQGVHVCEARMVRYLVA